VALCHQSDAREGAMTAAKKKKRRNTRPGTVVSAVVQPKLPPVGVSVELLLSGYAGPLLAALADEPDARPVHQALRSAEHALSDAWGARRMCERLVAHADALASAMEQTVEVGVRALFDALSPSQRTQIFPRGLGAAVAPRAEAQVQEAVRLSDAVAALPPAATGVVTASLAISRAALALSLRLAALESEERRFADALLHECTAERQFRRQLRQAAGQLSGIFNDAERVGAFFPPLSGEFAQPPALPTAPPASRRKHSVPAGERGPRS
jgi:hypothetical protein